jgi:hypothetical protein
MQIRGLRLRCARRKMCDASTNCWTRGRAVRHALEPDMPFLVRLSH